MPEETQPLILTIDDNEAARKLFSDYLSGSGYRVVEAENGKQGVETFNIEQPDIVLVDLRMPVMDGFAVLKYLREKSPQTPVIVISGTGSVDDVITALNSGAWDFIIKPLSSFTFLSHVIEKVWDRALLVKKSELYQKNLEIAYNNLKKDMEIARTLQGKLLPETDTKLGPLKFTNQIFPSLYLSGDFIDYFELDDEHIVFYMADVSGHGVPSALITVLLKSFIRKHINNYHEGNGDIIIHPKLLLAELNRELLKDDLDKFITLFYGIFKQKTNKLEYCNGGQFPYPILWQNNKTELLVTEDPPVAMLQDIPFHQVEVDLHDRFSLAMFSDGILEILPHDTMQDKTDFLIELVKDGEEKLKTFILNMKSITMNLPDDISVLTVYRGTENEK